MYCEQQFSNLIYDYFLMRFQSLYYHYGDYLPTTDVLCREFGVSPQTIKAVYKRLRAEGHIAVCAGKPAMVTFKQDEKDADAFVFRYYSERWEAGSDLYLSGSLFFVPMFAEGLRRMNEEEIAFVSRLAKRANSEDFTHFYCLTLQKIENPLALNLFWETTLFQGIPFARKYTKSILYNANLIQEGLNAVLSLAKAQEWDSLPRTLFSFQTAAFEKAREMVKRQIQSVPKEKQIPFIWRIYRGRPQIRYSLASKILHEIYFGEYREIEVLPSYEKMAEKYGVSVSTMRHTVSLLNQIGAAQTINGIGTRVFSLHERCNMPNFVSPSVRRILSFFFQAFELVVYSCEEIFRQTLLSLTPADKAALLELLLAELRIGCGESTLWHVLLCIGKHSPLQNVQEIYQKIYCLFLWGYPLKASQEKTEELDKLTRQFTESVARYLQEDQMDQCAAAMKKFVTQTFSMAEQYLLRQGIQTEELRLSPSIRLLITDGN